MNNLKQYNNAYINIVCNNIIVARSLYATNIIVIFKHKGQIYCYTKSGNNLEIKALLKNYLMIHRLLEHNILNVYYSNNELYLIAAYSKNKQIGIFNKQELQLLGRIMRMPIKEK